MSNIHNNAIGARLQDGLHSPDFHITHTHRRADGQTSPAILGRPWKLRDLHNILQRHQSGHFSILIHQWQFLNTIFVQ